MVSDATGDAIVCTDGSSYPLPSTSTLTGDIVGVVQLVGTADASTAELQLDGIISASTAPGSNGDFAFADLPIGVYSLRVVASSRPDTVIDDVIVVPGTRVLPTIYVTSGERIIPRVDATASLVGADYTLQLGPSFDDEVDELVRVSHDDGSIVRLGKGTDFLYDTPDPDVAIVVDLPDSVSLVRISSGTRVPLSPLFEEMYFSPDGAAGVSIHSRTGGLAVATHFRLDTLLTTQAADNVLNTSALSWTGASLVS